MRVSPIPNPIPNPDPNPDPNPNLRVGLAEHHPAHLDRVGPLPHHARDGPGHHVLEQRREERLLHQVLIVLLEERLVRLVSGRVRLEGEGGG